jgi:outer membrane receptor protein involved in Fe transport
VKQINLIIVLLVFHITMIQAATTGKVAGRILDKVTGNPLPGANIELVGTGLGAAADLDGEFFILNITPGKYVVEVSLIGYKTTRTEEIVVSTNATTTLEFELEEQIIEGEVITVSVDAISGKKDVTSSIRHVSADVIAALPVQSVDQVVSMQAGVVNGHFRGGRLNEVSYLIDGMQVDDVYGRSAANKLSNVEAEVVQDIEVISGTFNAEYGRAMSGIVNAVTKDGGNAYHGSFSSEFGNYYTNNDLFIGLDKSDITRNMNYRLQIAGPIVSNLLSFLVNTRFRDEHGYLNGIYRFNPSDYSDFSSANPEDWYSEHTGDNSFMAMDTYKGYSLFTKLTFTPFTGIKTAYTFNRVDGKNSYYSHYMKYNPLGQPTAHFENNTHAFQLNHSVAANLFYEIKLQYIDNQDASYLFEDPLDPRYVSSYYGTIGNLTGFSTGGQNKNHNTYKTKRSDVKIDVNWQFNKYHSFKVGGLYTKHNKLIKEYAIQDAYQTASLDALRDTVFTPSGGVEKIRFQYAPKVWGDTARYSNIYQKKPIEIAAYLQDKMEFEDMVINIGIRYDYFDPKTVYPSDIRNPDNLQSAAPERQSQYLEAEAQYQISPRFGLSYVLSRKAKLHFSYGHFFQMPDANGLYTDHNFFVYAGGLSTIMGNPQLKAEKSVKYEIGLWQELLMGLNLDVALYYTDIYNLLSTKVIETYKDWRYGMYTNKDYGNRKGLEVSVDGRFQNIFTRLNYSLQYTQGNADNPLQTFNRAGESLDPIARLIPLSWDQRHTLNLSIGYIQKELMATFTAYYNSGMVYTWEPYEGNRLALINLYPNNSWKPANFQLDFKGNYEWQFYKSVKLSLGLLIYNLLDNKGELNVNSTTGRANQQIIHENELENHHSNFNTYEDRVQSPANISPPREIKLSIGFLF